MIHAIIQSIVDVVPLSISDLAAILQASFPHKSVDTPVQTHYLRNVLVITDYIPALMHPILEVVISRLLQIDVEIQVEVDEMEDDEIDQVQELIFGMDDESASSENTVAKTVNKLDFMMETVFEFLTSRCQLSTETSSGLDIEACRQTFVSLMTIFERLILRTFQSRYTQFLVFYFCTLGPDFSDIFLGLLAAKVLRNCNVGTARASDPILVSCAAYLGSFLARAKFIDEEPLRTCFSLMLSWTDDYISSVDDGKPDAQRHSVFYGVSQSMMYIFCFRHTALLEGGSTTGFKSKLKSGFERLVHCSLNPLLVSHVGLSHET